MTYNTSMLISVIKKCHKKTKSSLPSTGSLARVLSCYGKGRQFIQV